MTPPTALNTIQISDPDPFGDVTLAPSAATGRSEADLARGMAAALRLARPSSGADALKLLRNAFPATPLSDRVAALDMLMRR